MNKWDVEAVVGKRITNNQILQYLIKWKREKKPKWEPVDTVNCYELILDYENSLGPEILGAKKEDNSVTFLAKFNTQPPKIIQKSEANKWKFNIIDYLESKIVWVDEENAAAQETRENILVDFRDTNSTVIYASKGREGVMYFFEYEDGIAVVKSSEAIVKQPQSVYDFLIRCMD